MTPGAGPGGVAATLLPSLEHAAGTPCTGPGPGFMAQQKERQMALLKQVQRGKVAVPRRVLLYGTHGVGKSTWASMAEKPIFIQTENGLAGIECERFPLAGKYEDVLAVPGKPLDLPMLVPALAELARACLRVVRIRQAAGSS